MGPFWKSERFAAVTNLMSSVAWSNGLRTATLTDGTTVYVADVDVLPGLASGVAFVMPPGLDGSVQLLETRLFEQGSTGWRMAVGGRGPLHEATPLDSPYTCRWISTTSGGTGSVSVVAFSMLRGQVVVHRPERDRVVDLNASRGVVALTWTTPDDVPVLDLQSEDGTEIGRIGLAELLRVHS